MITRMIFIGGLVLFMVAAVYPGVVLAGVDHLASPTPQPTERIVAPEIIGIYPVVAMSEGTQGETHPSDILILNTHQQLIRIDLAGYSIITDNFSIRSGGQGTAPGNLNLPGADHLTVKPSSFY